MKMTGICIAVALMVIGATTMAFAKVDTLHKKYNADATTAQRAKSMHQQKMIVLRHPQKMASLHKQYAQVSTSCRQGHAAAGAKQFAAKGQFYRKAQQQSSYKHDCPYRHGLPQSATPVKPDAKSMHKMKSETMKGDCCATEKTAGTPPGAHNHNCHK